MKRKLQTILTFSFVLLIASSTQLSAQQDNDNAATCYAVEVMSYNPAKQNDGTDLPEVLTIIENALGAPQNSDETTNAANFNFVTLGFGGDITLRMSGPIANGEGNDIKVFETTFNESAGNCRRYPETIQAFASQNGCDWVYIGQGCQDAEFDLGPELEWAEYIKLVDVSPLDNAYNGGVANGYDVDGVACLNGFVEEPVMQDLGNSYAMSVVDFTQGKRINGTAVSEARSNPEQALGAPQNSNSDETTFYSMGFSNPTVNGTPSITLKFGYVIFDKEGADLDIVETSFGNPSCNSYAEQAFVQVSLDNENWADLGVICLDEMVDFAVAGVNAVQYIRLTERSLTSNFNNNGTADGYDLDGIIVMQPGCQTDNPDALRFDNTTTPDEEGLISLVQYTGANLFSVQFAGIEKDENFEISIFSIAGQKVASEVIAVPSSMNVSHALNLNRFDAGIYVVRAQSATKSETFKVIAK